MVDLAAAVGVAYRPDQGAFRFLRTDTMNMIIYQAVSDNGTSITLTLGIQQFKMRSNIKPFELHDVIEKNSIGLVNLGEGKLSIIVLYYKCNTTSLAKLIKEKIMKKTRRPNRSKM
ncbi:MAG: hypothetical protein KAH38_05650 [Candidatus Hydrogenedentes bacterium]|nr:hypothetical protein [Candidatus Hydrogenedentota bacterium]